MPSPAKDCIMIEIEDSEDETSTPPPTAKAQDLATSQSKGSQVLQPQTGNVQMTSSLESSSRPSAQPMSSSSASLPSGYHKLQPQKDTSPTTTSTINPRPTIQPSPASSSSSLQDEPNTLIVDGVRVTIIEEDDPALQRVQAARRDCRSFALREEWRELERMIGKVVYHKYPDGTLRYEKPCGNCIQDGVVCLLPNALSERGRSCHHCRIWHRQCDAGNRIPTSFPVTEYRRYLQERDRRQTGTAKKTSSEQDKTNPDKRPHTQSLSVSNIPANTIKSKKPRISDSQTSTSTVVQRKPNGQFVKSATLADDRKSQSERKATSAPITTMRTSSTSSSLSSSSTSSAKPAIDLSHTSATELCNLLDDHISYFNQLQERVASARAAIDHLLKKAHQPPSFVPADAVATVTRGPVNVQKLDVLINTPIALNALRSSIKTYQESEGLPNAVQEKDASKVKRRQSS